MKKSYEQLMDKNHIPWLKHGLLSQELKWMDWMIWKFTSTAEVFEINGGKEYWRTRVQKRYYLIKPSSFSHAFRAEQYAKNSALSTGNGSLGFEKILCLKYNPGFSSCDTRSVSP
jgi:hypothetical protein